MNSQVEKQMQIAPIPGAGVDGSQEARPGVPMEKETPEPAGNAHWLTPQRMPDPGWIQKRAGLEELTPVFGTTVPPRGLSGLMRRAAYRIPEHFTSHWLVLLAADRVDVLEDRLKTILPFVVPLAAAGVYFGVRAQRRTWWRALLA
ncbi:MAG: hypothetical protein KIT84_18475 [Labilithrix sp.]|nr:hypothetical protein [Labilithrix sp.]MCW5813020.1 hypothetical protein [Labilithrix sp.]